ncbi:hypothetical protein QBC32DRAFT_366098 [Pseudoneurospora amorphoporcata]|uniref:Uncharacterized protein n=1 Tax=Pseudoneurospora amorphoporcata TaxID=241081 RepID=A0AAN6SAE9_9PEZI|nr:hypothetical protein QBC32DRAFT_366098 [Pseudoneurospora amorphoporcata]
MEAYELDDLLGVKELVSCVLDMKSNLKGLDTILFFILSFNKLEALDVPLDDLVWELNRTYSSDMHPDELHSTILSDPALLELRAALLDRYKDPTYEARIAEIPEIPPDRRGDFFQGPIFMRIPRGWGEPQDRRRETPDVHWIYGELEDKSDVFIYDMAMRYKRERQPSIVLTHFLNLEEPGEGYRAHRYKSLGLSGWLDRFSCLLP